MSNPLNPNDSVRLPGWVLLFFVAALAVIGPPVFWLLPERTMPVLLTAFFGVGLVSVLLAVAPLGAAALPALGLRRVGARTLAVAVGVTMLVSFAASQLGQTPEGVREVTDMARRPAELLPLLAILSLLAPLVEELVFRGLLFGWVAGRWNGFAAFIVSSLAFAAAHVELAHIVMVLPLGLWFGWLRWRTGSLVPSLVAHVVNNGIAVIAAVFLATG